MTRTMRSLGQITALVLCSTVFVLVGLSFFSGPTYMVIIGGVLPVAFGTCAILAAVTSGARFKDGRVRYRALAPRAVDIDSSGVVSIDPRMYLPFVYLHELVVTDAAGNAMQLTWASPSSFRTTPSRKALARKERLEGWLAAAAPAKRAPDAPS